VLHSPYTDPPRARLIAAERCDSWTAGCGATVMLCRLQLAATCDVTWTGVLACCVESTVAIFVTLLPEERERERERERKRERASTRTGRFSIANWSDDRSSSIPFEHQHSAFRECSSSSNVIGIWWRWRTSDFRKENRCERNWSLPVRHLRNA